MSANHSKPVADQEPVVHQESVVHVAATPRPMHERTTPGQYLQAWNELYRRREHVVHPPPSSRPLPPPIRPVPRPLRTVPPIAPPLLGGGTHPTTDAYLDVLNRLCGDNLKGKKCRTWAGCVSDGSLFRCPAFPSCPLEFTHKMHLHKNNSWKKGPNNPCTRENCYNEVDVYHIAVTCLSIRKREPYCLDDDCSYGHDYPELRAALAKERIEKGSQNMRRYC
jgi:hypothetical protein